MDMLDQKYMRMAMDKAREGMRNGQTPFGACIVREGKILSCEHNVVWQTMDITAHAEVHAIRAACRNANTIDLSGSILYSTCEPCPMCFAAIHWARISKVIFGARIEDAQSAGFHELTISNQQMKEIGGSEVEVVSDFMRSENQEIFKEFIEKSRGKIY